MKINKLKINGFGKVKNKEINLGENINLIYGKNETGKSTILKFISSMFYGISKNKNGKEISDYDRYKPWNLEEFSGKINYSLDNKEQFEVFREFTRKNPQIYDINLEEISKKFNIDKNKGNQFFYEQTKIDELLFLSTNIVEQQEVVLDKNNQNILTQKIANILSSGEDNISYKKVMEKLSKRLIEDVGTERTVGRPLNEITEKIEEIKNKKNELDNFSNVSIEIKENKKNLIEEINNIEKEINLITEIKNIKEKEEKENEKININKKIEEEYNEKINYLKNKIKNLKVDKINNKINKINLLLLGILLILNMLIIFINLSKIIKIGITCITIFYAILILAKNIINKNKKQKQNKYIKMEKIKIDNEIDILEENKKNSENEIKNIKDKLLEDNKNKLNEILNKFNEYFNNEEIQNLFNKNLKDINEEKELLIKEYNNKQVQLNIINIKESEINNKIQNKFECEEELEYYEEQKQELLDLEKSIKMAKEALDVAYSEMRNEITPRFTQNLSSLIERISNSKYRTTKFDSENGLRVEKENGEYIDCNRLSIGTIDQLYLSLRLSAMNEISEEKMPIILDEAFAYYDDERLENILKYIHENYKDNQIIIFTCSNREKEILEKINIEFNYINI